MSLSRIDLCRFAESTAAEFEPAAAEKGLTLEFSAGVARAEILGDKNRLKEVLHNLLENAIRYTENGHVAVRVEASNGSALVVVEDTGAGIDEKDMPYVFDRFFRSDRARRSYRGGSGLGLSIVRWIVEAHKGQVRVESKLGQGSRFFVALPLIG
jgi:signal transduction histidine kinase